jgi:hypothetical protein
MAALDPQFSSYDPDGPPVPNRPHTFFPIRRARVGSPLHIIVVNDVLVGRYTHHHDRRTYPCDGLDRCSWCRPTETHQVRRRRWYGWLGAWDLGLGRLVLAEVTAECARQARWLTSREQSLRGLELRIGRLGSSERAACGVIYSRRGTAACAWDQIDVRRALAHIWGYVPGVRPEAQPATDEHGEVLGPVLWVPDDPPL